MKYLLITSVYLQERNIGILKCDDDDTFNEDSLRQALEEHFDEDVIISSKEQLSVNPLTFEVMASSEEKDLFKVELCQTWLY